ncbi:MAG: phasin family protein [Terricaulis silvestris]
MSAKNNGAQSAESPMSSMAAMMQGPAANGFVVSQRLAHEATRFWAQRMRAYADQVEVLAKCTDPNQIIAAQAQFIERMQAEFAAETEALSQIWKSAGDDAQDGKRTS